VASFQGTRNKIWSPDSPGPGDARFQNGHSWGQWGERRGPLMHTLDLLF